LGAGEFDCPVSSCVWEKITHVRPAPARIDKSNNILARGRLPLDSVFMLRVPEAPSPDLLLGTDAAKVINDVPDILVADFCLECFHLHLRSDAVTNVHEDLAVA